jgi:hypothetical protein
MFDVELCDVHCVAAPVLNSAAHGSIAISAGGQARQMTLRRIEKLGRMVRRTRRPSSSSRWERPDASAIRGGSEMGHRARCHWLFQATKPVARPT